MVADKIDNRTTAYGLRLFGEYVWKRFNASKEEQFWYYSSLLIVFMGKKKIESEIFSGLVGQFPKGMEWVFGGYFV
jgi:hypothetical protein